MNFVQGGGVRCGQAGALLIRQRNHAALGIKLRAVGECVWVSGRGVRAEGRVSIRVGRDSDAGMREGNNIGWRQGGMRQCGSTASGNIRGLLTAM